MSEPYEDQQSALDQVLILAPYRRDVEYLGRLLEVSSITSRLHSSGRSALRLNPPFAFAMIPDPKADDAEAEAMDEVQEEAAEERKEGGYQ